MASQIRRRDTRKTRPKSTKREKEAHTSHTVHWDELEDWQKDNEYIVRGYRRAQHQWKGCLTSVFSYFHNETINIHSHLWGAVMFIYFLSRFYPTYVMLHGITAWEDVAVIVVFLCSAVFCLAASALYHTSGCHSEEVASYCHAYDYSGIVVLTVGSFYPAIYYGFFCHPSAQKWYLSSLTLAGLIAAYIVLNPEYAKPSHRGARTSVFIGLGLCGLVPTTHMFFTHGLNELISEMGINWLLTSAALYIGGALLYCSLLAFPPSSQCESNSGTASPWTFRLFICFTPTIPRLRCPGGSGALPKCAHMPPIPNVTRSLWVGRMGKQGKPSTSADPS